jgi:hypothetical protein
MHRNFVCRKEDRDVTTYGIAAALAVAASFVLYAIFRPRHRCSQQDPLCRRGRPCIHCYRELYKATMGR